MINLLPDWLIWLAGGALALVVAWFTGRVNGKQSAKVEDLIDYNDTRKRIGEADKIVDDDDVVIRERLRKRGQQ